MSVVRVWSWEIEQVCRGSRAILSRGHGCRLVAVNL